MYRFKQTYDSSFWNLINKNLIKLYIFKSVGAIVFVWLYMLIISYLLLVIVGMFRDTRQFLSKICDNGFWNLINKKFISYYIFKSVGIVFVWLYMLRITSLLIVTLKCFVTQSSFKKKSNYGDACFVLEIIITRDLAAHRGYLRDLISYIDQFQHVTIVLLVRLR